MIQVTRVRIADAGKRIVSNWVMCFAPRRAELLCFIDVIWNFFASSTLFEGELAGWP
jgi:hypothetical protein